MVVTTLAATMNMMALKYVAKHCMFEVISENIYCVYL